MTQAIEKDFDVVHCVTLEAARQVLLAGGIDLIIGGIHFDESRMFNLLRYAQADPASSDIPFMCVKILDDRIAPTFMQSAEIASRALGASGFIDFSDWRQRLGDMEAAEQLRRRIHELLP